MGQALALLYFPGFTSLFFTLSILWQEGLGHSALQTGLLVLPFAAGSMLTASNSYRFSRRFGRTAVLAGIGAMLAGQALIAVVLRLSGWGRRAVLTEDSRVRAGLRCPKRLRPRPVSCMS